MGLAATRKRVKLSHDPNNTKWTRDTESFGHKTLTAQGWQPGDLLGAKNSACSDLYTIANASHIRVIVKDDKLGLGAKRGSGMAEGECTGLDVFQNILGRLNGKDEAELVMEQKIRENLNRAIYNEHRRGLVRFVKGGFLVGDKLQELANKEEVHVHQMAESLTEDGMVPQNDTESESIPTKHQKNQRDRRKDKKSAKLLLEKSKSDMAEDQTSQVSPRNMTEEVVCSKLEKSKNSKKRRKQPASSTHELNSPLPSVQGEKRKIKKKQKDRREHGESFVTTQPSALVTADTSDTPQALLGGRHAVRSRNIAQKRLAVLDTASLNQIFMIKK